MIEVIKKNILYLGWVQAIVATGGSLFYSEVMKFQPCVLCWYQRIAVYPMVILLAVAIYRKDRNIFFYTLPILVIGWIISLYHNLLYYKIIPDTLAPCSLGVSCTTKFVEYFGFITIPLQSFVALTVMILCVSIFYKTFEKYNK